MPEAAYWRFYREVAQAQLVDWLPREPLRVLDLSGEENGFAARMGAAGHEVVQVVEKPYGPELEELPGGGRLLRVVADTRTLDWLADASVDAVLAESRALSYSLATEVTVTDIARVLRPGGRLLLCVDSLLLGLAQLAEQGRWAELADVPSADVVLVRGLDGTITRCFWPEELAGLLQAVGLEVDWIRPRCVLSQATVERALQDDPDALPTLVRTEVVLARGREGESIGIHLLAAARRPA